MEILKKQDFILTHAPSGFEVSNEHNLLIVGFRNHPLTTYKKTKNGKYQLFQEISFCRNAMKLVIAPRLNGIYLYMFYNIQPGFKEFDENGKIDTSYSEYNNCQHFDKINPIFIDESINASFCFTQNGCLLQGVPHNSPLYTQTEGKDVYSLNIGINQYFLQFYSEKSKILVSVSLLKELNIFRIRIFMIGEDNKYKEVQTIDDIDYKHVLRSVCFHENKIFFSFEGKLNYWKLNESSRLFEMEQILSKTAKEIRAILFVEKRNLLFSGLENGDIEIWKFSKIGEKSKFRKIKVLNNRGYVVQDFKYDEDSDQLISLFRDRQDTNGILKILDFHFE